MVQSRRAQALILTLPNRILDLRGKPGDTGDNLLATLTLSETKQQTLITGIEQVRIYVIRPGHKAMDKNLLNARL